MFLTFLNSEKIICLKNAQRPGKERRNIVSIEKEQKELFYSFQLNLNIFLHKINLHQVQ